MRHCFLPSRSNKLDTGIRTLTLAASRCVWYVFDHVMIGTVMSEQIVATRARATTAEKFVSNSRRSADGHRELTSARPTEFVFRFVSNQNREHGSRIPE